MKGLIISLTPFFGGGENYVVKLIKLLNDNFEFEVVCACKTLYVKLEDLRLTKNYFINESKSLNRLIESIKLVKTLKADNHYDFVILNGQLETHLVFCFIQDNIKIFSIRHSLLPTTSFLKRIIYYIEILFCTKVITVSGASKSYFPKILRNKVSVIYNWHNDIIVEEKTINNKKKIISISRIVKDKNVETLLEACKNIQNIEVIIIGDGDDLVYLRKKYSESKYIFTGYLDSSQIEEHLKKADIFVSCSSFETFGLSVLEAFFYNVATILSDIPAHREISNNGKCSLLYPLKDTSKLKECIELLVENEDKRLDLISRAKIERKKFLPKNIKSKYLSLLNLRND